MARSISILSLTLLVATLLALLIPSHSLSPPLSRRLTPSTPTSPTPTPSPSTPTHSSPVTPSPLLSLSASAPLTAQTPIPFLGLFSNPSSLAPGATVLLTWECYFCTAVSSGARVTISTNDSALVVRNGSLDGRVEWTVSAAYQPGEWVSFVAVTSDPLVPTYSLELRLRAPNPRVVLVQPANGGTVRQSEGLILQWTCDDCYAPPATLTLMWRDVGDASKTGTLICHVPVPDSGTTHARAHY